MGMKEKNNSLHLSRSNSHINVITKHSSQFRDNYAKYHLFENRWTTIRLYQKLPYMVQKNFQKVLERGISRLKPITTIVSPPGKPKENNFLMTPSDDGIRHNTTKKQTNENIFWCDPEQYLQKIKCLNHDISIETNEITEFSNLVFLNYRNPFDLEELTEERNLASAKLNNILGTLNYNL